MSGTQQMVVWLVGLGLGTLVALMGIAAWVKTYEDDK